MPTIRADPYDVVLANGNNFVEDVLKKVFVLSVNYTQADPGRWLETDEDWLVVDHLKHVNGSAPRWEGAIQRSANNEHPQQSGPTVGTKPLNLPKGVGIGTHVAFLYDEVKELLWLQRDRDNVGKGDFADYLRVMSGTAFSISQRLRDDSIARARTLTELRRLELSCLTENLTSKQGPLGKLVSAFTHYGAYEISIILKPKRGGTLDPDTKELFDDLVEHVEAGDAEKGKNRKVTRAVVKGKVDENDEDKIIDLIRDKQRFAYDIPKSRNKEATRLINAVRVIWSNNRAKV